MTNLSINFLPAIGIISLSAAISIAQGSDRQAYLIPSEGRAVAFHKIVGANETVGAYRMVGTPDGLSAYRHANGEISIYCTHALPAHAGVERAHGARGAFISEWRLALKNAGAGKDVGPELLWGRDLIQRVYDWSPASGYALTEEPYVFDRLSSSFLAAADAFAYEGRTRLGTDVPILLSPEEPETRGRAFAHFISGPDAGSSYVLPDFGYLGYEQLVPHPVSAPATQVIAISDRDEGMLLLYQGRKQEAGHPLEQAGLVGGDLYLLIVENGEHWRHGEGRARFSFELLPEVESRDAFEVNMELLTGDFYKFARPKDGAWDPNNSSRFILTTQGVGLGEDRMGARVYALEFASQNLLEGGEIRCIAREGEDRLLKLDNCEVDRDSTIWVQENPGRDDRLARVYRLHSGGEAMTYHAEELAHARPDYFDPKAGDTFITNNEESCGIVSLESIIGPGWFAVGMHSHVSLDSEDPSAVLDIRGRERLGIDLERGKELVEDGQIMLMWTPPGQGSVE